MSAKTNRLYHRLYQRRWYRKNIKEQRKKAHLRYLRNRDHILELVRKRYPKYRKRHKVHARRYQLALYGLTLKGYAHLYKIQKGRCAVCSKKQKRNFCVDHHHASGKVRGLLCGPCNQGLGLLKDNPKILAKAKSYLERKAPIL